MHFLLVFFNKLLSWYSLYTINSVNIYKIVSTSFISNVSKENLKASFKQENFCSFLQELFDSLKFGERISIQNYIYALTLEVTLCCDLDVIPVLNV